MLKRDDLLVEEIDIWDCLIKWGIQTSGLESDGNNSNGVKWNQESFETLKKIMSQYIPLIRFVEISSADFYEKVRPYETVIPHHISKEIAEFYHKGTLPKTVSMMPRIVSTIVNSNLAMILANWIDRNDSNVHSFNNKYKFNLIYKKSWDGFDRTTFHNKCNGQGPVIILVKVQSKKIYGGYNSIGYALRSRRWLTSSDSFIFSFEIDQDIYNMKIGRVINKNFSIMESCDMWLFNFGNHLLLYTFGSKPLLFLNNGRNYDDPFNLDDNRMVCLPFEEIEDIEVFNLVKNNSFT